MSTEAGHGPEATIALDATSAWHKDSKGMEATPMKRFGMISTAALLLLFGNTALTYALPHQGHGQDKQDKKQGKSEKQTKDNKQRGKVEKQQQDQQAQKQQDQDRQTPQRAQQEQSRPPQRRVQETEQNKQVGQQRAEQVHERNAQRKLEQQQQVQQVHDRNAQRQQQNQSRQLQRLSEQEQRQRIELQQRNWTLYQQNLDQRIRLAQQQNAQLQQQNRMAQYRFQQDYYERLRQQQIRLQNERDYNYNNDPFYYTGWTYRYNRGGTYYQTNQYGADLLRQAVNSGYQEGFRAGQADRQDRWRSNYQDTYAYQDANFGYNGRYVQQDEYNYYFREGFRRGYEDGFNSRNQYGSYSNGRYSILGAILGGILNLESIR
jgi:hypothetical protein